MSAALAKQTQVRNVSKLHQNRVYNHILSFINAKGSNSKNTAREYETDIRQFFSYMKGKTLEQLEAKHLKVINSDVLDYRTFHLLKDNSYKNTTANRKINTIRSLYRFLKGNEYDVNPEAVNLDNLPDDSQGIGFLSPDEAFLMAELAVTHEKQNKHMKRALIYTAFATSMREDALLKLTYNDIRQSETNSRKYIIEPDFLDKGKKIYKVIHVDVYNLMLEAKEKDSRVRTDDRIFTMDAKGANQMIKRLCKIMGIDPRRKVSFHSLRKAGADFVYEITGGDMAAVTAQGNWSSPTVPYKNYMKKQNNLAGMVAFEKVDEDVFKQLTHEELLKLVEGIGNGLGAKLRSEAQEIVNSRNE
jgi:site-specific recombinase XerD